MLKRLLAVLFALGLVVGFTAACGDDDDEGGDDTEASAEDDEASGDGADEEGEEPADEEMSEEDGGDSDIGPATQAFCEEFNEESGGDTPVDEVEASIERAQAAQDEIADPEVVEAVQTLIDLGRYLIDNDDGDGMITDAETQAALAEFPDAEAHLATVGTFCSG